MMLADIIGSGKLSKSCEWFTDRILIIGFHKSNFDEYDNQVIRSRRL